MKDGPFRSAIKRLGLGVYNLRLSLHRANASAKGNIRYELGGACVLCAKCCDAPGIQVGVLTWYVPLFRRIFLLWHRHVNGFELVETHRSDRGFIFRCTHFDRETRRCDSYHSRPGMCRDYPRLFLEQANPELFDGCGYKPVSLSRRPMLEALEQQALTPEQMKKLKKELFLEE